MNPVFSPADIERTAQAAWRAADAYRVVEDPSRAKFYACSMLPYPSGKLHMGHVRNYTINDMMARQLRMQGKNVLMPMGWDAFGLPAENAAIANDVPPAQWTRANIAEMKAQMEPLGLSIDWSREVATCDPGYYRWNQWFFLRLLEQGLAYKKTQTVNWDPVDQTVLANEQVIDGRGWRSGALVEKREIPGYYLAITRYADELLANVAAPEGNDAFLHGWPERVRLMQAHWIGKSTGVRLAFPHSIAGDDGAPIQGGRLWVFTTRADTLMGATFCAVAAEHPLALYAARTRSDVAAFVDSCRQGAATEADIATRDKLGVDTGLVVQHPLTGVDVPVWVGNYVLMSYGDGAVMGVPAHDERDFAFARRYGIDVLQVVSVAGQTFSYDQWQDWYADKGGVTVNSDNYSGMTHAAAVDAIAEALAARGLGGKTTTWRLRDWGISRQRYWGTPIPIVHCGVCGDVPVPDADLPVVLPEGLIPDGSGNPLAQCAAFVDTACPRCGAAARRETDTMDTFVDSAWYFMRYCCPDSDAAMVDARAEHWMPMDQYIGGIEHAVLHLLYARFWTKAMRDLGLVGYGEPFTKLFTQGMLLNESYFRDEAPQGSAAQDDGAPVRRRWFYPNEVDVRTDERGRPISATAKADGLPVSLGGIEKMSKSKNNVVEPRDIIARFGADTARLFTMFAGPPEQSAVWSDAGAEGAWRYLRRLWNFGVQQQAVMVGTTTSPAAIEPAASPASVEAASVEAASPSAAESAEAVSLVGTAAVAATSPAVRHLRREVHRLLQQITNDYERLQYNTVVSGAMKLLNALEAAAAKATVAADADLSAALREGLGVLLRTLSPVAPHITHVLWTELGHDRVHGALLDAPWPAVDASALLQDTLTLMLQINGKLRGEVTVPADADKADIEAAALASPELARHAEGRAPRKVVVVPGRLVNVVV